MFKEHSALSLVKWDSDEDMAKFQLSKEKIQAISRECNAAMQWKRVG